VRGKLHPLLLISLIERLPASSAFAAQHQNKQDWHAYLDLSPEYYVMAGIYDAVNINTGATGNFKRPPKFKPWPMPQEIIKKSQPTTVATLFARMSRS